MNINFTDIHGAADYIGPGAIEVPMYQTEITDLVRRRGIFGQRIKQVPATGHPSRYFEETAIPAPAASSGFVDPRNIIAPLVSPTRVERSVPLKALVAQINYNLFDIELGRQQSQFAYLQAKDLTDTVDGVLRTHDVALWNGTDTSLSSPTTAQYFGAAAQIAGGGNSLTIGTAQSIVDGVKFNVVLNTREITSGFTVKTLSTQAGDLPLIPEWTLPYTGTPGSGSAVLPAYIVTEDLIEYHWLSDANPRIFQLGVPGSLASQYVVVKFGGLGVKGASYAHYQVLVDR